MNTYRQEIFQTIILLILLIALILVVKEVVKKFTRIKAIDVNRRKVILQLNYLLIYIIFGIVLAAVWGVEFKQLVVFMSSILAVLGVGFFAQWSILSNLTASVILFFNHPVRIGDRIKVIDKDFNYTGKVNDITGFFLFMKTDLDENITLPTSYVLQRGIQILDKEDAYEKEDDI